MPTISHDDAMSEFYARNPEVALAVLEGMLVEDGPEELLVWMRQMAGAFGGVKGVAAKSKLNATQLYRMLSAQGNPTLTSLLAVLKAMKLRLAVVPMAPEKKKPAAQKKAVKKRRVAA